MPVDSEQEELGFWRGLPMAWNSIELYRDRWVSFNPDHALNLAPDGLVRLLKEDSRVYWVIEHLGDISHWRILELGPLEGRQSYTLHERGAAEIIAIEGNASVFKRLLAAQNAFGLTRMRPILGNFVDYLNQSPPKNKFDLIFASGVLYHLEDPLNFLERLPLFSSRLFLWTHVYNAERVNSHPGWLRRFGPELALKWNNLEVRGARQCYTDREEAGFCGGLEEGSLWLARDSLLAVLEELGYSIKALKDDLDNPNGQAIWIAAQLEHV